MRRVLVISLLVLGTPAVAQAADIVYPPDGATVSSKPTFIPDFALGKVEVEWARAPDVRSDTGRFVDADLASILALAYTEPFAMTDLQPSSPIVAGRWFWHAKLRDDGTDPYGGTGTETPWLPVRQMVVRDEPIVFAGWTVRRKRISRAFCKGKTRFAYQLTGQLAWADNSDDRTRYRLKVRGGGRTLTIQGEGQSSSGTALYETLCSNARQVTITPTVIDSGGHRATGMAKRLRLR